MSDLIAELEACPFCGGEAELTHQPCDLPGFDGKSWSASCRGDVDADCFASTFAQFKTREYAIEAWNKRTHHAEIAAAVRDAVRYRWLRNRSYTVDHDGGWSSDYRFYPVDRHDDSTYKGATPYHYGTLDAAIDSAMRAGRVRGECLAG